MDREPLIVDQRLEIMEQNVDDNVILNITSYDKLKAPEYIYILSNKDVPYDVQNKWKHYK